MPSSMIQTGPIISRPPTAASRVASPNSRPRAMASSAHASAHTSGAPRASARDRPTPAHPRRRLPVGHLRHQRAGCFLIGVLMVLITEIRSAHRLVRPFLDVGVSDGFTTFLHLHQRDPWPAATRLGRRRDGLPRPATMRTNSGNCWTDKLSCDSRLVQRTGSGTSSPLRPVGSTCCRLAELISTRHCW
jgi:hypothetical protein